MKLWKLWFTFAGMGVELLDLVTRCLKQAKRPVVFLHARGWSLWSVISLIAKLKFLVDVYNVSECGRFLSYIHAFVKNPTLAKFLFVGK